MQTTVNSGAGYDVQITREKGEGFTVRRIGPYLSPRIASLQARRVRYRPDQVVEVIQCSENNEDRWSS
jgi:hypothetical protein